MSKYITVLVALSCVVASPVWGAEWERIAEEVARIVFYPPGLSGGEFKKRGQTYFNEEWAIWRGVGTMPRAEIYLAMLFPDRIYNSKWKLENVTRRWNFLKKKHLNFADQNTSSNVVGSIRYQHFSADNLHCVSFLQGWGEPSGWDNDRVGEPRNHLYGYYCDMSVLSDGTVKTILSRIGWRGYKVPAKPESSSAKAAAAAEGSERQEIAAKAKKSAQETTKTKTSSSKSPQDVDTVQMAFWDSIKYSTNAGDYRAYIKTFPNGQFLALARYG